jgi:hypothetical protein
MPINVTNPTQTVIIEVATVVGPKGDKGDPGNGTGIDKTALVQAVQDTLTKADNAVQPSVMTQALLSKADATHTHPIATATVDGLLSKTDKVKLDGLSNSPVINPVTTTANGLMLSTDKTKLDGIAANATANATDALLRDRTTHTGVQAISTVTGLQTALDTKYVKATTGIPATDLDNSTQTILNNSSTIRRYQPVMRDWSAYTGVKKLALVGDSTTYLLNVTAQNLNYIDTAHRLQPGSALYGVTVQYFGANGNTLANFLANAPAGSGILDVIAASPTVDGSGYGIEIRYGINDIRLQATGNNAVTLANMLKQAVNQIRAALPKVSIVLRCPNSFLTTDVSGYGYVVPNTWAQGASDALRDAYNSLVYEWDNVVVRSLRTNLFPDVCPVTSGSMADQLHPSVVPGGFKGIIDEIAATWSVAPVFKSGLAKDAQTAGYSDDYSRYALITENSNDYTLIANGLWSASGNGYIDFAGDLKMIGGFIAGDIVVQNRMTAFAIPQSFSQQASGANIRLSNLGTLVQPQVGGEVSVYRRNYAGIAVGKNYYSANGAPAYPFSIRCMATGGAGVNYIRLQLGAYGSTAGKLFSIKAGDILIHPTLGAVTITSAPGEFSNNGLQISQVADFTMPTGSYEVLVVGQARDTSQPPISFYSNGVLSNQTLRMMTSGGGIYSTIYATLGTAGTTPTTIVIAKSGTTVVTLTFAANSTTPTIVWASGTSFCTTIGKVFTATITAGTGASDLAISMTV